MIAEAQIAIHELEIDDIQDAKYEIAKHQQNNNQTYTKPNQRRTPKTKNSTECKKKIKKNSIIHLKADNVNGQVLKNKNEYIDKTLEFIKENNFTEKKKNPTNKYQREIKELIK